MIKTSEFLTVLMAGLFVGAAPASRAASVVLVAHWEFDETTGSTAADATGAYPGTLLGEAEFVAGGISGRAVSLNPDLDSVVSMGTAFPNFVGESFSLVAWIQTTSVGGIDAVLTKEQSGAGRNGYLLLLGVPFGSTEAVFSASNSNADSLKGTTPLADGKWHQLIAVYEPNGTQRLYVDGMLEASGPSTAIVANGAPFLVGGFTSTFSTTGYVGDFTGLIDDVQVYRGALTSAEVQFLHARPGVAIPEPSSALLALAGSAALLVLRRRSLWSGEDPIRRAGGFLNAPL